MPSSTAGITQYWDESTTKLKISPATVMIIIGIIIVLEIIFQTLF